MDKDPKQVCSLTIIFPIDNDEQAIEYKKKITAILSEISDAQIRFSIMSGSRPLPSM